MRKVLNITTQATVTYSQNKEDIILASFFEDVSRGFYVDVGAAHPDYLSTTKYFYMRGWHGIAIEPNERLYNLLSRARPRDSVYHAAVTDGKEKTVKFREYLHDNLSTLAKKRTEGRQPVEQRARKHSRTYEVATMRLSEILEKAKPKEIHFMKVDVAGCEHEALKSNDWTRFRPHIVCVEVGTVDNGWYDFMKEWHYQRIFHDGINDYYADMKYYDSPPTVDCDAVYEQRVLSATWAERIEDMQRELREKEGEVIELLRELSTRPGIDGGGLRFRTLAKIILKKTDLYITGKITPQPKEIKMDSSIQGASAYDKAAWDAITASHPSMSRSAILKGYTASKRMLKKAVKAAKGTKR